MPDHDGVQVSGNTVRWASFIGTILGCVAVLATVGGAVISHSENAATRDSATTHRAAVETQLATVTARLDAHDTLIKVNADNIKLLNESMNQKMDTIQDQLRQILKEVGRLDGKVGTGRSQPDRLLAWFP